MTDPARSVSLSVPLLGKNIRRRGFAVVLLALAWGLIGSAATAQEGTLVIGGAGLPPVEINYDALQPLGGAAQAMPTLRLPGALAETLEPIKLIPPSEIERGLSPLDLNDPSALAAMIPVPPREKPEPPVGLIETEILPAPIESTAAALPEAPAPEPLALPESPAPLEPAAPLEDVDAPAAPELAVLPEAPSVAEIEAPEIARESPEAMGEAIEAEPVPEPEVSPEAPLMAAEEPAEVVEAPAMIEETTAAEEPDEAVMAAEPAEESVEAAVPETAVGEAAVPAPAPSEAPETTLGEPDATVEPAEPTQTAALTTPPEITALDSPLRLLFERDEVELPDGARDRLAPIALKLQDEPNARLQLQAFAVGSEDSASQARRVSLARALAVRSYLIERGVRSTRIDVRALGAPEDEGPPDRVDIILIP